MIPAAPVDQAPTPPGAAAGAATFVALRLARVCRLEADFHLRDCAGIAYVGQRRAATRPALSGLSWIEVLERYSRLHKRRSKRARATAQLPWGDVPGWSQGAVRGWQRLRRHAEAIVAGQVPDPCRGRASHWGGPGLDEPRGRMVGVECGATANDFYAVRAEED